MEWWLVHLIPLLSRSNEVLQSWPWVNLSYFQCKDETDRFSRCFEYPAHHITQESQRWMSVTAVLTDFGTVPSRFTALLNVSAAPAVDPWSVFPTSMQRWKWPVLEMFGIPGTCLSRHRITAMNVCDSRFDRLWHGAKSSHSLYSCQLPEWGPPYLARLQNLHLT